MAKSASIKIFSNSENNSVEFSEILHYFDKFSLSLISNKNIISYLPVGDEDLDWCYTNGDDIKYVENILYNKYQNNEIVGFSVFWKESEIGMDILIYPKLQKISFLLEINRQEIEGMDITDFTFYLKTIIPILSSLNISIEVIECIDS